MLWILKNSFLGRARIFSSFTNNNSSSDNSMMTTRTACGYNKLPTNDDGNNNTEETTEEDDDDKPETRKSQHSADPKSFFEDEDFESEYESEDDHLICWVCDRSFNSVKLLDRHKRQERHYGCGTCEEVFPSFIALEAHREEEDHWSDDADYRDDDEEQFSSIDSDDEIDCIDHQSISESSIKKEHLFLL